MTEHLVAYEYGTGAAWGFVLAPTRDAVTEALPEVEIYEDPPMWMTDDDLHAIRTHNTAEYTTVTVDNLLDGKRLQNEAGA